MAQFARRQIFPLCFPLLPRGINMGESREREEKISVRYPVSPTQPVFPAFANCASRETPLKSDGKHSLFQYLHRHHRIKQRVETGRKQTLINSVQAGEEAEADFVYYLQLSSPPPREEKSHHRKENKNRLCSKTCGIDTISTYCDRKEPIKSLPHMYSEISP